MRVKNIVGLAVMLMTVGGTIYIAYAQGLIALPEIPNPFKKNVRFDITITPNCFLGYCTIHDVEIDTVQLKGFATPPKFAWWCAPPVVPPPEFKVTLTIPEIGYSSTKTVSICTDKAYVSFVVGFDKPGTYAYRLVITHDDVMEWGKSYTVTVV